MKSKKRLEEILVEKGISSSRDSASALILAGKVLVNENKIDKPGIQFEDNVEIRILGLRQYVGRGAYKLKAAFENFAISVKNKICADVGSSTGGFTQILLEEGAKKVFAIDVGYGELDYSLRRDSRVVVLERTNARHLERLEDTPQFVTVDVSFISLKLILPAVRKWASPNTDIVALIKPQFEAKKEEVGEGGIVSDPLVRLKVLEDILIWCRQNKFYPQAVKESPISGTHGNVEYLSLISLNAEKEKDIKVILKSASA